MSTQDSEWVSSKYLLGQIGLKSEIANYLEIKKNQKISPKTYRIWLKPYSEEKLQP